jgi:hypothetical protein
MFRVILIFSDSNIFSGDVLGNNLFEEEKNCLVTHAFYRNNGTKAG